MELTEKTQLDLPEHDVLGQEVAVNKMTSLCGERAESVEKTIKLPLRKMSGLLHTHLLRFQTPAEMPMNRKLHSRINTVVPINTMIEHKQL